MPRIFAISDLHLSLARPKPMAVFGPAWDDHVTRVERRWRETVGEDDLVLLAGDFSWAMKLADCAPDLAWLAALPGEKVLVKGNHDYWWESLGKVRRAADKRIHFVQNDIFQYRGVAIGGTRLWDYPEVRWAPVPQAARRADQSAEPRGDGDARPIDDEKIRRRELDRLRQSLALLPPDAALRVALVHYPPVAGDGSPTPLTAIMDEFAVDLCVYGHLHHLHLLPPEACRGADCTINRTRYLLTSCDWLDCSLKPVGEFGG